MLIHVAGLHTVMGFNWLVRGVFKHIFITLGQLIELPVRISVVGVTVIQKRLMRSHGSGNMTGSRDGDWNRGWNSGRGSRGTDLVAAISVRAVFVGGWGGFHAGGPLAAPLAVALAANAMTNRTHVSVTATTGGTLPVIAMMSIRSPVTSTSMLIVAAKAVVACTVRWSARRGLVELGRGLVQLRVGMDSGHFSGAALVGRRSWGWQGPHGRLIRNGKLRTVLVWMQETLHVVLLAVPARNVTETKFLDQVLLIGHFMLVETTYATQRQSILHRSQPFSHLTLLRIVAFAMTNPVRTILFFRTRALR